MCYILGGCLQSSCINLLYLNSQNMKMKILKRKEGTAVVTIKKSQGKVNSQGHWVFPTQEIVAVGFPQPLRCCRVPSGMCLGHCWCHTNVHYPHIPAAWNCSPLWDHCGRSWHLLYPLQAHFSQELELCVCEPAAIQQGKKGSSASPVSASPVSDGAWVMQCSNKALHL